MTTGMTSEDVRKRLIRLKDDYHSRISSAERTNLYLELLTVTLLIVLEHLENKDVQ